MEVICNGAGRPNCYKGCSHAEAHERRSGCKEDRCSEIGEVVVCLPTGSDKSTAEDLVNRLKDQINRTEQTSVVEDYNFDRRIKENQILIMEALAALLEGK